MRNGFANPLGFCIVFRTVLGMRNEFAGLIYFRTVCEIGSQGVQNWFAGCAKLVRRVCEIGSQGVRNFHSPCEMSHEFRMSCENFTGCVNCLGFSFAKNL